MQIACQLGWVVLSYLITIRYENDKKERYVAQWHRCEFLQQFGRQSADDADERRAWIKRI